MMQNSEKMMIYVHYDPDSVIDEHVIRQLKEYRPFAGKLIFLSNSALSDSERRKVAGIADEILLHHNRGYDFAAWKDVILEKETFLRQNTEELILTNSSCFGPLFPLNEMFDAMRQKKCSFWGITKRTAAHGLPEHLASYFLVFRKDMLCSDSFFAFWRGIRDEYRNMAQVIHEGEHKLTAFFRKAGFRDAVYCGLPDIREDSALDYHESFTTSAADELIRQCRIPLLKVKAFENSASLRYPKTREIFGAMKETGSTYPPDLIVNFLRRTKSAEWQLELPGTLLITDTLKSQTADCCPAPDIRHDPEGFLSGLDISPETGAEILLQADFSPYMNLSPLCRKKMFLHARKALFPDLETLSGLTEYMRRNPEIGMIMPSIPPVLRFAFCRRILPEPCIRLVRRELASAGVENIHRKGYRFHLANSAEQWSLDAMRNDAGMQERRCVNGKALFRSLSGWFIRSFRHGYHRLFPRLAFFLMPLEDKITARKK